MGGVTMQVSRRNFLRASAIAAGKVSKIIAIKGDMQSTVNRGVLCTKGFYLHRA